MTPTALAEQIVRLGRKCDERPGLLIVSAPLVSAPEQDAWEALRAAPPPFVESVSIKYAGTDLDLAPGAATPNDIFQITIEKVVPEGEIRLFFAESITCLEAELSTATKVKVARMTQGEEFQTCHASFEKWTNQEGNAFVPRPAVADPRVFVRDLTGATTVPGDLRPWLIHTAPQTRGTTYQLWAALAALRVFAALSDQVTTGAGGTFVYTFNGPPRRTLAIAPGVETRLGEALQKAGEWVYTHGSDADTRHLIYSTEWARAYNPYLTEPLHEVCDQARDSAAVAYGAYVRKESRETLQALAGLREAVVEETQRTRERAQELAGALWKDLAVASAPFVLKILADAGRVSPQIAAGLAFAAAVFLAFSYALQVYINNRFFAHQSNSRSKWQDVLGRMSLTPDEVNEISVQPVTRSMSTYYRVRAAVGIVYLALVLALITVGHATLQHEGQPQGKTPPADTNMQTHVFKAGAGDTTTRSGPTQQASGVDQRVESTSARDTGNNPGTP